MLRGPRQYKGKEEEQIELEKEKVKWDWSNFPYGLWQLYL
jgi:hypothetical protein